MMLPKSCRIDVIRYAGAANGINWQILSIFLNLNSQLDKVQPFIIPSDPPKILVKKSTLIEPIISFLPVISREKFPSNIVIKPSFKKIKIGDKIKTAVITAKNSRNLKFLILLSSCRFNIVFFKLVV